MTETENILKDLTHVKIPKNYSPFSGHNTYSGLFLPRIFDVYPSTSPIGAYYINCYIDDFELKHNFKYPLFVLLKTPYLDKNFAAIEGLLKDNKNFVYTYSVGTNYEDYMFMYVYECPEKFVDDYVHFLNGEYSQFSEELKKKFPKYGTVNGKSEQEFIYGVINKTKEAKKKLEFLIDETVSIKQEYFAKPKTEYEVFRYNQ